MVDLTFPFLYFLVVNAARGFLGGKFSLLLFESIAYFYIGYFAVRNLLSLLDIDDFPWSILSYFLLSVSILALFMRELSDQFFATPQVHNFFFLVFKASLILLIYLFFFRGLKFLADTLPGKFKLTAGTVENLRRFFSVIYLILAALWLLKIIRFSSSFFSGILLSLIAFSVYAFARTYFGTYLRPKIDLQGATYPGLVKNVTLALSLALVFALYNIFRAFFNLNYAVDYLSSLYLIKTNVIALSLFSVVSAIYMFVFLLALVAIMKHAVYFYYVKRNKEIEAGSMRALVSNLGLLIVIPAALSELGLTWKALLPIAGALGLGVGIGLQNVMNNYISGFILLFSKKLKVGDIVEVDGNAGRAIGTSMETIYGKVVSIDSFSTILGTTDGIEIAVPNSQFIEKQIVNYSLSDYYIRVRIPFGVSYASDPDTVKGILLDVAKRNSQILDKPPPSVWFSEMADSALMFHLLGWVNIRMLWKINPVVSDIYFKGWYELEKAGVVIPFPQRDVWFKNGLKVELVEKPDGISKTEPGGVSEVEEATGSQLDENADLSD